jgi:hypothetical protein
MKAASGTWKKDKPKKFKVREDDPCKGVAPPDYDPEDAKDLQWLYPREYARLCLLPPQKLLQFRLRRGSLASSLRDDFGQFADGFAAGADAEVGGAHAEDVVDEREVEVA